MEHRRRIRPGRAPRVGHVILVRHAHAGHKANWDRDDGLRPLTARGLVQAESLVRSLTDDEVSAVWSSAAVRCRQTVEPLAAARGVAVQDQALLAVDGGVDELMTWILGNASAPWALCTHGEVLHTLLDAGRSSGRIDAPARATEKGAAWRVRPREDGSLTFEYLPPLKFR
ncbi:phosphoglycerate mutase family protein [Pengzhenrongella frigida]|uniref:Phosphoglycerate mutase family protein n=1 Tax=Pengzhenrongella frigida TaxID=1259133 RepID=A0A4Q5MXS5_9MICO|nr:phosphoglycerate mutase family protein [Cellulomonas sp. HLT2-17]